MIKVKLLIKRIFDIIFSIVAMIILSPIIVMCAILVRMKLGSPILFKQKRIGKNNKIFEIIKFRTMKDIRDRNGNLLDDSQRLTKFGEAIRSLSVDELPELFNIFKGDMSFVGPRPLLIEYLSIYNKEQIRRHDVIPGLTGFAQVSGRNNLTWNEKFKLDVFYVDNWSLWFDIKILFKTIITVFKREGISQQGQATVEDFNGYN